LHQHRNETIAVASGRGETKQNPEREQFSKVRNRSIAQTSGTGALQQRQEHRINDMNRNIAATSGKRTLQQRQNQEQEHYSVNQRQ